MTSSQSIAEISKALVKAQKAIKPALKDSKNPFFKSSYADLTSVIEACKEALNTNGIIFLQPVSEMNVETWLIHESGEYLMTSMPITVARQNDPQAMGSAITYARRYALQSFLGMGAEDDDAESAKPEPVSKPEPKIGDKCSICGTQSKFHRPDCPNGTKNL